MIRKLLFNILITLAFASGVQAMGILTISEVYGGGGNSGSYFTNDFVEIYNPSTTTAVDLNGYSVQYASATGSFSIATTGTVIFTQLATSSFLLQPGHYFLVQEAKGTGGTTALPTADVTGTIALSATNGKVALVNQSTAAVTGPTDPTVVDFFGFGTANQFEGTVFPALTNTTSGQRKSPGTDTDNNANDFLAGAPNPENSAGMVIQAPVPEPSTYAFLAGGVILLVAVQRLRRRTA